MKTKIVYFSRTGKTRQAATKLASAMDAPMYELKDDLNWNGFIGWFKGGYYASKDKMVNITFDQDCLDCEQLIVLSPLWAGGTAPAIRAFLRQQNHDNVTVVITNNGSDVTKAFQKTKSQIPSIQQFFGITHRLNNEDAVIEEIVSKLK